MYRDVQFPSASFLVIKLRTWAFVVSRLEFSSPSVIITQTTLSNLLWCFSAILTPCEIASYRAVHPPGVYEREVNSATFSIGSHSSTGVTTELNFTKVTLA